MSIYKKLFEAKKEIGKISKDSTNPFFKSKYFDINGLLEHVEPILEKHGLLLLQPVIDGKVKTIICDVNNEDGKMDNVVSEMQLPNIQDPQKLGSAITYYRRYTLQSLLGLQAEDDDGNSAKKQLEKEKKQHTIKLLNGSKNLTELQTNYLSLSKQQQVANVSLKNELKIKLK
jgi:hypothetical protein